MSGPQDPIVMTVSELDACVETILFVEAWADAVRAEIQKALEAGAQMERAGLEPKRGTRKWDRDEEIVISNLADLLRNLGRDPSLDVIAPRKVVTPAAAEKLVGKRAYQSLSNLVTAESSGYNLKLR